MRCSFTPAEAPLDESSKTKSPSPGWRGSPATRSPIKSSGNTERRPPCTTALYWLAVPQGSAKAGSLVIASRKGQVIQIDKAEGVDQLTILLNDAMLDLDKQDITVRLGEKELFKGKAVRTVRTMDERHVGRGDPFQVFSARGSGQVGGEISQMVERDP